MFSSIQSRNTLSIIAAVVLFLAVLLLVNYLLLRDFSLEHAERTSTLILDSADSQLDIIFNEIEALVLSMTTVRAVYEVYIDDMSELFINNVLVRQQNVRAIYLGTEDGRMFEWGVGEGFTDYTPKFPEGYDPRVRPWYRQAVESDSYGLTSPYIFASIEAIGITAVAPVYNKEVLVGVLGLDLIMHGLDNVVDSLDVPMDGKVMLLNSDMAILVNQFFPTTEAVTELETFRHPELIQTDESFIIADVYGAQYMISTVENLETGWIMLLFLPYKRIMNFSQQIIMIIILFDILLTFLLGSLIAFITRNLVTNPLDRIISIFRRFESGDISARIPDLPGREFGLISRLFNRLSDQSAEFTRTMEGKVEQRTQAVIRLQKENVRLRIIEEKERIYGNLHDSLGARLTSINISNHVARSALERNEKIVLSEMLDRIEKNTGQGIQDLKEILKAGEGDAAGPVELLDYIGRTVRERLALKDIKLETRLPSVEDAAIFEPDFIVNCEKIIQELVSNTMKHSGAALVRIELDLESNKIKLNYMDNGNGFVLKDALRNGFGLQGLYSRAERMDGILKISSRPGRVSTFNFQFRAGEE